MAGSWPAAATLVKPDFYAGHTRGIAELSRSFTADAANGSVPDWTFTGDFSYLVGARVLFGTPGPNALVVAIKDSNGITVLTSSSLTGSGVIAITKDIPFITGGTVSISGNSTNGAIAKIVLYFEPSTR